MKSAIRDLRTENRDCRMEESDLDTIKAILANEKLTHIVAFHSSGLSFESLSFNLEPFQPSLLRFSQF